MCVGVYETTCKFIIPNRSETDDNTTTSLTQTASPAFCKSRNDIADLIVSWK